MEEAKARARNPHWRASERCPAAEVGASLGLRLGGGFCCAREIARLFTVYSLSVIKKEVNDKGGHT